MLPLLLELLAGFFFALALGVAVAEPEPPEEAAAAFAKEGMSDLRAGVLLDRAAAELELEGVRGPFAEAEAGRAALAALPLA